MADYHSPTVVTQALPIVDMTPLELLLLECVFDAEQDVDGVYFHSWCGSSDMVTLPVEQLHAAREESRDVVGSTISGRVDELLAEHDRACDGPDDDIDVDMTCPNTGWDRIFQDIVRRSATIDEIVVTTAFTCSKMRSDGFGGSIMRITGDAIQSAPTFQMLETMRESPNLPATDTTGGHGTRRRLEVIAGEAGWDSFTLVLLIAQWLNANGHTEAMVEHLDQLAGADAG